MGIYSIRASFYKITLQRAALFYQKDADNPAIKRGGFWGENLGEKRGVLSRGAIKRG